MSRAIRNVPQAKVSDSVFLGGYDGFNFRPFTINGELIIRAAYVADEQIDKDMGPAREVTRVLEMEQCELCLEFGTIRITEYVRPSGYTTGEEDIEHVENGCFRVKMVPQRRYTG